jgi:SAM-dependent methyltransferase
MPVIKALFTGQQASDGRLQCIRVRAGHVLAPLRRRAPVALKRRWWRLRDPVAARLLAARWELERRRPGSSRLPSEAASATRALAARLRPDDREALDAELSTSALPEAAAWRAAAGGERERLAVTLGVALDVPGVTERTGLRRHAPPGDVHHMAEGPLSAAGSLYHADLVADALLSSGAPLASGSRVLDFGCSSGRVVHSLAAAFPDVAWHGCDPHAAAIAWARVALGGIEFEVSSEDPPLPYDDASFDAVYAISVWSHFDATAATAWLAEMRRIVRPGGRLVLTAHGYDALADYARRRARSPLALSRARRDLDELGFAFVPSFAPGDDWGLQSEHWGEAYLSPEWLGGRLAPDWALLAFAAGRNEGNQDVYVLGRRDPTS